MGEIVKDNIPPLLWTEEPKVQPPLPLPPPLPQQQQQLKTTKKRKIRSNKKEFQGWGSKQLVEYLESIGEDTSKQHSQFDVTDIINKYVHDNKLIHPEKKKRIVCDEKLHSLFGRKSVGRIKIYDLLDPHFAENQEEDEEDDEDEELDGNGDGFLNGGGEEYNGGVVNQKKIGSSSSKKLKRKMEVVVETPKSCFAAVIPENIKLVYLRRSLVQKILKEEELEMFENKLVGSFVRIKSDPNDYLQKNSHQLLQVMGVKKASGTDDINEEILLQVSNSINDVSICMLSDDNFSEEEYEDLHRRIKDGLLKRPTVVDLEQKVRLLHQDITNHWLVRELSLLQNLIDRANEKGWRREYPFIKTRVYDYLERRQLLQTPAEQSRLLLEVPKVIAEELDLEATIQNFTGCKDSVTATAVVTCYTFASGGANQDFIDGILPETEGKVKEQQQLPAVIGDESREQVQPVNLRNEGFQASVANEVSVTLPAVIGDESREQVQPVNLRNESFQASVTKKVTVTEVIDLSDEESENLNGGNQMTDDDPGSSMWHYMDPQGDIQGPFSSMSLKHWSDADYFPPGFMVWKTDQTQRQAILLSEMLSETFPD